MARSKFRAGKTFTFQWNYSNSIIIGRKGFGKETNKKSAEIFRRYAHPYVPYLTGKLSQTTRIRAYKDHATITYLMPYAKEQYSNPYFRHTKTVHPLATHHWDKATWVANKYKITGEINAWRKRYAKK